MRRASENIVPLSKIIQSRRNSQPLPLPVSRREMYTQNFITFLIDCLLQKLFSQIKKIERIRLLKRCQQQVQKLVKFDSFYSTINQPFQNCFSHVQEPQQSAQDCLSGALPYKKHIQIIQIKRISNQSLTKKKKQSCENSKFSYPKLVPIRQKIVQDDYFQNILRQRIMKGEGEGLNQTLSRQKTIRPSKVLTPRQSQSQQSLSKYGDLNKYKKTGKSYMLKAIFKVKTNKILENQRNKFQISKFNVTKRANYQQHNTIQINTNQLKKATKTFFQLKKIRHRQIIL